MYNDAYEDQLRSTDETDDMEAIATFPLELGLLNKQEKNGKNVKPKERVGREGVAWSKR